MFITRESFLIDYINLNSPLSTLNSKLSALSDVRRFYSACVRFVHVAPVSKCSVHPFIRSNRCKWQFAKTFFQVFFCEVFSPFPEKPLTISSKTAIIIYAVRSNPRGRGGIGIRARLRGVFLTEYGFKSRRPHQQKSLARKGLKAFFVL